MRESFIKARHSIFIVGWDIDSRTRLVGESGEADDGFPATLAEFLSALVQRRPELTVRLLLWDYSVLYAFERELFPQFALQLEHAGAGAALPRRRARRSAARSIRRSSWSTTRWRFPAGST